MPCNLIVATPVIEIPPILLEVTLNFAGFAELEILIAPNQPEPEPPIILKLILLGVTRLPIVFEVIETSPEPTLIPVLNWTVFVVVTEIFWIIFPLIKLVAEADKNVLIPIKELALLPGPVWVQGVPPHCGAEPPI